VKVSNEDIQSIINDEVIKREVLESENGIQARKDVKRFLTKAARQ